MQVIAATLKLILPSLLNALCSSDVMAWCNYVCAQRQHPGQQDNACGLVPRIAHAKVCRVRLHLRTQQPTKRKLADTQSCTAHQQGGLHRIRDRLPDHLLCERIEITALCALRADLALRQKDGDPAQTLALRIHVHKAHMRRPHCRASRTTPLSSRCCMPWGRATHHHAHHRNCNHSALSSRRGPRSWQPSSCMYRNRRSPCPACQPRAATK